MEINKPNAKFRDMSIAPMHSAEHILNQTMVRMFGCPRSRNAHIERKKSKCDYRLETAPDENRIFEIESRVNEVIGQNLPVWVEFVPQQEAAGKFDLGRLPDDASEMLRIVHIGEYDACPCIGQHVENTSEIGQFSIISFDYTDGCLRLRFKLQ